jgi:hypothetical protein
MSSGWPTRPSAIVLATARLATGSRALAFKIVLRDLFDRRTLADTGIVDQNVERWFSVSLDQFRRKCCGKCCSAALHRQIGFQGKRSPARSNDLADNNPRGILSRMIVNRNNGAVAGKPEGNRSPGSHR